jgi:hypothetical protein
LPLDAAGDDVLGRPLRVINVGLDLFARVLEDAGVPVLHGAWRPPAGDATVAALLARLADDD